MKKPPRKNPRPALNQTLKTGALVAGLILVMGMIIWLFVRTTPATQPKDRKSSNSTATEDRSNSNTAGPKGNADDNHGDDIPKQPERGVLTLSPTSVTLSKNIRSAEVTITAPVSVDRPAVASGAGHSPVLLTTEDGGDAPRTSWAVTVTPDRSPASAGTYYIPIQAVHNGAGLKYYYVNLAVHIIE